MLYHDISRYVNGICEDNDTANDTANDNATYTYDDAATAYTDVSTDGAATTDVDDAY